MKMKNGILWKR